MAADIAQIQATLVGILRRHCPPLEARVDLPGNFEVAGTKPTMQGKQQVKGFYFASVVPKPTDVRFYFFPNYTHPHEFTNMSAALKKCLKGKSCFHIKQLTPDMEKEIEEMVKHSVAIYQQQGWV